MRSFAVRHEGQVAGDECKFQIAELFLFDFFSKKPEEKFGGPDRYYWPFVWGSTFFDTWRHLHFRVYSHKAGWLSFLLVEYLLPVCLALALIPCAQPWPWSPALQRKMLTKTNVSDFSSFYFLPSSMLTGKQEGRFFGYILSWAKINKSITSLVWVAYL